MALVNGLRGLRAQSRAARLGTRRALFGVLAVGAVACGRGPSDADRAFERPLGAVASADSSARRAARNERPPGENPFGLPPVTLSATVGAYVLAPSRASLEEAFERGPERQSIAYSGAVLEELGAVESRVRSLTRQRARIPNVLIVPIRPGARAEPGRIVLTSRASGSGLVRAIAVGGDPATPRVRYLDGDGGGENAEEVLSADSFHVLGEAPEPGRSLACRVDGTVEHLIWLSSAGELRVGLGFAGRIRVAPAGSCRVLPLEPRVRPGDRVYVPLLDGFVPASVVAVDDRVGRVLVDYELAGKRVQRSVGFTNVALELP